jgi:DNA repair protein RecN (Recombination protein N)
MLHTLRVKNLAIVENVLVEFNEGFNVITGETGAGKSILVGALGLILGERADRDVIRAGEDACGVEATFQLPDPSAVNALLDELGISQCEDGRLVIRRIVSASGSGKIHVNDSPATVQALKRVGDLLVDMHGPHEHQSLLSRAFQLDVLDSFGDLWELRSAYQSAYREMLDLETRRKALDCDEQQVAQQIDALAFQVKEIEEAGLSENDEQNIEKEHAVVANATRILELAEGIRTALTETETSAFNSMTIVQSAMRELAGLLPEAADWQKEATSIAVQLQELSDSVNGRMGNIESDPNRLQWLDDRLALIRKLKRKYGPAITDVLSSLEKARIRLNDLKTRGEQIAVVEKELGEVLKRVKSTGRKLAGERAKTAGSLANAVTKELRGLGFPNGAFEVSLREVEPGPAGLDETEFGFAPNVGEPMRPLRAIASSGEISRVMLATKVVLASHDTIPVLAFDEIDANIGGEMGIAVGEKLRAVARNHQVLCITHLPQVAVHGATHFVVTKEVKGGRTITNIKALTGDDRAEEVARMLGGRDLTSVTLRHAREMLKKAE